MPVFKDEKNNSWRVIFRYVDFTGTQKQTSKRGFKTRKEAQEWEYEAMRKVQGSLNMTFESFWKIYKTEKQGRVKESTWESKEHIVKTKILPYFGKRKIQDIKARDVIAWQNELMKHRSKQGKAYSPDYLRSIHAQLTAIFNHAVNYYRLPVNPARQAGTIGKEIPKEKKFWTTEEYLKFAEAVMDKPLSYYAFEVLYWTGIREGELLALTPDDFDLEKRTLRINKTYHRKNGKDVITDPKTKKSNRVITIPDFLCDEIRDYLKQQYELSHDQRMFPVTKYYLTHEMERGCKASGVKRIRIHDLRHSHVSLLINMGYSALAIGERVGHEAEKITYGYAHLFPTVQSEMANKLEEMRKEKVN